jgi:hypothetical protein
LCLVIVVAWPVGTLTLRYFKDTPLGPVNVWERDPKKMRENDEQNVAAQNRLYVNVRRAWPVPILALIAAIVALIV